MSQGSGSLIALIGVAAGAAALALPDQNPDLVVGLGFFSVTLLAIGAVLIVLDK